MAKNLVELLNMEGKTQKESDLGALVELLFKAQMETHITHILQRKKLLCEHNAMADFYEGIDGLIDSFAELSMAHGLIGNIVVSGCSEIVDTESYMQLLYNSVEGFRQKVTKYPFLISKLDDIQELISQTLYRLKFIQS